MPENRTLIITVEGSSRIELDEIPELVRIKLTKVGIKVKQVGVQVAQPTTDDE